MSATSSSLGRFASISSRSHGNVIRSKSLLIPAPFRSAIADMIKKALSRACSHDGRWRLR